LQGPSQVWASKAGREATPTLRDLVEHGILQPGQGVLSYKHSGNDFIASLTSEGTILYQGEQDPWNWFWCYFNEQG
jgi:Restriction Enzyme Adenine Methylase Associated